MGHCNLHGSNRQLWISSLVAAETLREQADYSQGLNLKWLRETCNAVALTRNLESHCHSSIALWVRARLSTEQPQVRPRYSCYHQAWMLYCSSFQEPGAMLEPEPCHRHHCCPVYPASLPSSRNTFKSAVQKTFLASFSLVKLQSSLPPLSFMSSTNIFQSQGAVNASTP